MVIFEWDLFPFYFSRIVFDFGRKDSCWSPVLNNTHITPSLLIKFDLSINFYRNLRWTIVTDVVDFDRYLEFIKKKNINTQNLEERK